MNRRIVWDGETGGPAPSFRLSFRSYFRSLFYIYTMSISRLIRFIPRAATTSSSSTSRSALIGEPVDRDLDVGLATYAGKDVEVDVYSGSSILSPGSKTGKRELVDRLLSPISKEEVGTIRCIGLNVSLPI